LWLLLVIGYAGLMIVEGCLRCALTHFKLRTTFCRPAVNFQLASQLG